MLELLVNEIMLLKINEIKPLTTEDSKQKMAFLEEFLNVVFKNHPDLENIKPQPQRLRNIVGPIKRFLNNSRSKLFSTESSTVNIMGNERPCNERSRNSSSGFACAKEHGQQDGPKNVRQKPLQSNRYDLTISDWRKENRK